MYAENTKPSKGYHALKLAAFTWLLSGSGSGNNGGFGFPDGGFRGGVNFDVNTATRYRTIHGILAAMAFVILFPVGAMAMRLIPGRSALWLHGITQVVAYISFIVAVGLGIWLVQEVRIPVAGGSLLNISGINYHPIIGLVVFAALFFQPILGAIHHSQFKRLRRRQIWSHLHLWNGRIMIPLGIINGGLGLRIAGASKEIKTAYAVVAGVLGGLWISVAIFSEVRRRKAVKKTSLQSSRRNVRRDGRREKAAERRSIRADSQSS
ncbi:hypothetical protein BR93DRAFT_947285 [Coniochaeta sp. PMI_546]|nr:hypothetical protein BR93DRAFT_947285 [Coniochaeta sp. PMI_546]